MRLLDLYCGAGGAAMGYRRAGFETIVGVDHLPQPRYPFTFVQADALTYAEAHAHAFDAIHASPPCQRYSPMGKGRWAHRDHADLVAPTRAALRASGRPYVIENVRGAPLEKTLLLCGTMFGLQTPDGTELRRHRLFEVPWFFALAPPCQHERKARAVAGGRRPGTIGVWGHAGGRSMRDGLVVFSTADRETAMGIDWMREDELSQAIPPAYTEYIGRHLREIPND